MFLAKICIVLIVLAMAGVSFGVFYELWPERGWGVLPLLLCGFLVLSMLPAILKS